MTLNKKTYLTSAQIREKFINYFKNLKDFEHEHVPSSALVPAEDPTLLFTNAGMVQFKDVFLGNDQRSAKRAVTCQRCVRAGGKHNDLENVGYTKRHHTFFEMLGNFSFGDYFKREAIRFAWDFLTKELLIPAEKLWVTVHEKDQEAEKIWLEEIGVSKDRLSKCGDKDNFWAMGETGPCGYCSEIFYDHGAHLEGNPPGIGEEDDGERYVEIWNLVFMEFARDAQGNLARLPNPSIDTGMGLERIAAVMQGVDDNYETDVFKQLGDCIAGLLHDERFGGLKGWEISYREDRTTVFHNQEAKTALKVISDHVRAAAFLIADGVLPSNEGRGYVLRKIIRRAVRFLYKLGCKTPFLGEFCDAYLGTEPNNANTYMFLAKFYPELISARTQIAKILQSEETLFLNTLSRGIEIFEDIVGKVKGTVVLGEQAFLLYDTFGFPLELTREMAKERGLTVDEESFNQELTKQRQRSKAAGKFKVGAEIKLPANFKTEFVGYKQLSHDGCKILALYKKDGAKADYLKDGEEGIVVLDVTPFYAESGGQIGDAGMLFGEGSDNVAAFFEVTDTKKQGAVVLHYGMLRQGVLNSISAQKLIAEINVERRQAIALNHSAAHLVHAALHQVIGAHATQRGSMVDAKRLRFDFANSQSLTEQEIADLERIVNQQIRANLKVSTDEKSLEEAKKAGVVALFGEKYGEKVRVVKVGEFSSELCGGTHVAFSGEIGLFKITAESGVAAGIRRIEAVTGENALECVSRDTKNIDKISLALKVDREHVFGKIEQLFANTRQLETELGAAKAKLAGQQSLSLASKALEVFGVKVLVERVEGEGSDFLRKSIDQLKEQLQSAVILLATVQNDKISLIAGVTKDCTTKVSANEIIKFVAPLLDGSGGGRPDMAQGGGTKVDALDEALKSAVVWIKEKI